LVRHELTKDPEFLGLMAKNTKELADQIKLITEDKETKKVSAEKMAESRDFD
jgi:hypothetical protein